MGAACFKAAGDGSPEPVKESWGGSHPSTGSAGKPKAGVSPSRSSHRSLHDVKVVTEARIDRDVNHTSLGMESKSDSRSASSANSSTPHQCDARQDTGAGINPHFRSVSKPVPFSPRRGYQILSDSAPSLKLEPVTTPRRQKPTSVMPTVSKLPEEYSVEAVSDDDDDDAQWSQHSIEQQDNGDTSEFVEATAALQHYYASEMPGGDSEMPGASAPKFPRMAQADPIATFDEAPDIAFESALQTIDGDDGEFRATQPDLLPHIPAESEIERCGHHQASSIFDSPFVKQSTGKMWHNASDSDLSSGAKDSAKNGGSNSAASSAARSKGGSLGPSAVPTTPQRVSKASSPHEKVVSRDGRKESKKESKNNKSKEPGNLHRQRSGISDLSEEGYTLGTSKSLPMIQSAKKTLFPHSGHLQQQSGSMMAAGGSSLMAGGNSLMGGGGSSWMGGGGSLMGGGGSLMSPYGGMSMVSLGDASTHGSFMQSHHMKGMPHGYNPAYMAWNGSRPTPKSMPGNRGHSIHRTTSGPIADHRVRRHSRMRAVHAHSRSDALNVRRSKTMGPEHAAMLGRRMKPGTASKEKEKDVEREGREKRTNKHRPNSRSGTTPHGDQPAGKEASSAQGTASVNASDTTDGRKGYTSTSSKPSPSPPASGQKQDSAQSSRSTRKQAAEQAAAKQMQEAVENAAKMQQQMQQVSTPPASPTPVTSPHPPSQGGAQPQPPNSVNSQGSGKSNMPPPNVMGSQQQMQMQNMHRHGSAPPMMGMHRQMHPQMHPQMHAHMAAAHAAAQQQAAQAQAQMMLQPQNSRSSTSSSISLNPQAHPQARKGPMQGAMPMPPQARYGYHHMQPHHMMGGPYSPQMGGPYSPVNMPAMMPPGVMHHPQMGGPMPPPGMPPFPVSGPVSGSGRSGQPEEGKVSSEKSSGTEKSSSKKRESSGKGGSGSGKGGKGGNHRHSSSPSPQGHPPRSSSHLNRKSGRGPHSLTSPKSFSQSASDLRADAVAHIHLDKSPSAPANTKVPHSRSSNHSAA